MHATAIASTVDRTPPVERLTGKIATAWREQVFQELYDRHRKDVRNYIVWFLSGCRDVEDIVQEVFLRVYERLEDYDPARPARPWLLRIAGNVAINVAEKEMAQKRNAEDGPTMSLSRMSSDGEFLIDVPDHRELLPEEHAMQQEMLDRLQGLLADLPEHERELIRSLHLEGMSQREAAEALDMPRETVRDKNQRLLQTLRTSLESSSAA